MDINEMTLPDRYGFSVVAKFNCIFLYLYAGNELFYKTGFLKMDGDFNLYIRLEESSDYSLLTKDIFNTLVDLAQDIKDEDYSKVEQFLCDKSKNRFVEDVVSKE